MNIVVYISEDDTKCDKDLWFNGPGFYFIDETCCLNGSYETREECEAAFKEYVKGL